MSVPSAIPCTVATLRVNLPPPPFPDELKDALYVVLCCWKGDAL